MNSLLSPGSDSDVNQRVHQLADPEGHLWGLCLFNTSLFFIVCSPGIFACLALNAMVFLLFMFFLWVICLLLLYLLPFLHWLSDQHFSFPRISSGRFLLPETLWQNPNSSSSSLTNSHLSRVVPFSDLLLRWYHDALAILPACFFVPPDPTLSTFYLVFSQGLFSVSLASGFQTFNMSAIGLTAASPTGSHSCIY